MFSHPQRYYFSIFALVFVSFTVFIRFAVLETTLQKNASVMAGSNEFVEQGKKFQIESIFQSEIPAINEYYTVTTGTNVKSDVGFSDLRVQTLRDFFAYYNSPLVDSSDEFIEASEKYGVVNWQLLPAIAMAETKGCQTGTSFEQRNCWGWGGSEPNRWEFGSFDDAIDLITHRMIRGYGNERMNAKAIQPTYCGRTCMQWQWRWARGVNYYTVKINDFGERYGLPRTNEINNFNWP